MFHYTVTTEKSKKEITNALEAGLKEIQFGLLFQFDLHKKLEEKGFTPKRKYTILEVCNPNEASGVLAIDPMASNFLPCKIVISEDDNETKISLTRPTALMGLMENEQLVSQAKEIEEKIISIIDYVK
ncbi:DUF302 domain-containing protein [Tepidibacillus marianensis]|uniref:DUF302 domain-containing protein n=1 Tax=Tepidibacillus marianensis TaxID=3131995 RepID=UPI0030D1E8FD